MHLEDVSIEGFKSFSEETDMRFQAGISVIIGNNGAGKSNILDAVVWAMGEDSFDRLRCYAPDDLFFGGNRAYAPAQRVKVRLTLKESSEKNAPGVSVSREMDRNGTNRYAVEGEDVDPETYRRRLSVFHIEDALKTIIRQEQINDLLFMNPQDRREAVCSLMGLDPAADFPDAFKDQLARRLTRYMGYLMPEAAIQLDLGGRIGPKGLDIQITLPGDRRVRLHQLSGGQKAVTSLALKIALFGELKSPFYLLDEVEPSLDYTHHKSMQAFLKDVAAATQLIMITHLRSTIELADSLHGVRTRPDGSSFMKFYFLMNKKLLKLYKCC